MSDLLTGVDRSAHLSDCARYRYSLSRTWSKQQPRMLFIMLNPSTADHEIDDPTIRRCIGFAQRENFGALEVVNLYALRATDPTELTRVDFQTAHGGNITTDTTLDAIDRADLVVMAWGAHKAAKVGQDYLLSTLADHKPELFTYCLGVTKHGAPRHPLYLRNDQPLQTWAYTRPKVASC